MYNKITLIGKVVTPPSRTNEVVSFLLLTHQRKNKVRHSIITLYKLADHTLANIKYGNIVLVEGTLEYEIKNGHTMAHIIAYSITQILNYSSNKPVVQVSMIDTKCVVDYDYPSILHTIKHC